MGCLQRVFSPAIKKMLSLSNPFSKDDLDAFLTKESTEAYCPRVERKGCHLVVMF